MVRKARRFDREPDHEAMSITIEADSIKEPVKFRRSGDRNALQSDLDGKVDITIVDPLPNSCGDSRRSKRGERISGRDYTIDARKITKRGKSKVDPKRDIATASKYVRIFKRRRGE